MPYTRWNNAISDGEEKVHFRRQNREATARKKTRSEHIESPAPR